MTTFRLPDATPKYNAETENKFRRAVESALQQLVTTGDTTFIGKVQSAVGASAGTGRAPGIVGVLSGLTTSSVTEASLGTVPLPAAALATTTAVVRMRIAGQWSVASVNNQVRIKFGATYVVTITGGAAANEFWAECDVTYLTSTTQQADALEVLDTNLGAATVTLERTAPAETLSSAVTIDVRGKVGSGTLTLDLATVQVIAQ